MFFILCCAFVLFYFLSERWLRHTHWQALAGALVLSGLAMCVTVGRQVKSIFAF